MRPTSVLLAAVLAGSLAGACSSNSSGQSGGPGPTSSSVSASTASTAAPSASTPRPVTGGARWTTYDHDAARSGETNDGPASAALRRLWTSATLDGDVYAQPLLFDNLVMVATENDTVYGIDAGTGTIVWTRHVGEPVAGSSLPCGNVDPVGITSTPVIDPIAQRIYVVGLVQPLRHLLFALDLHSGAIIASTRVDAAGADPGVHNQRGALTLSRGRVLVPYGGRYGDCGNYHGRLVSAAVSASGFGSVNVYTLPTEREGGFWNPGGAALAPDGSIYLASGNSGSSGRYDYGNSVVRLSARLTLVDSFGVSDWAALNATDTDLGSTGPTVLPGNRVFQIGKSGIGYLLDAAHLGGIGGQLYSAKVCNSAAFGTVAHSGNTLFVPCGGGVAQVVINRDRFDVGVTTSMATPGPPIVAGRAVWAVATDNGDLVALDRSTGKVVATQHIGSVPSRFTSPAAGGGRIFVSAHRVVSAFGA